METNAGVPQPIPEIPARPEGDKQQQWDAMTRRVEGFRDGLGKSVDVGIKDMVVGLNVLGFQTKQSCEGHFKRAQAAPWVMIQTEENTALRQRVSKAFEDAEQVIERGAPEEDVDELLKQAHALRKERDKPLLEETRRAMGYLSDFYRERRVPYDQQISVKRLGDVLRLESQGALLQEIADPETKQQKLQKYQAEMYAFAGFLKERYFSSERDSTTIPEDTK